MHFIECIYQIDESDQKAIIVVVDALSSVKANNESTSDTRQIQNCYCSTTSELV